jgi:lambda family phage portal protein
MKILGFEFPFFGKSKKDEPVQTVETKSTVYTPIGDNGYNGGYWPIVTKRWDGEKTPGELGVVVKNIPLYLNLRLRGYDAFVKTDNVKLIVNRRLQYVIGNGLKLECEPNRTVLKSEGIESLPDVFQRLVEERWKIYTQSKYVDFEKRRNLHGLAKDFYSDKFKGGDCLVICRFEEKGVTAQFISGEHVGSPFPGSECLKEQMQNTTIEHGIECNERGEHVAYYIYVKGKDGNLSEYKRIPAYGEKSNRRLAWMIYGQTLSPDQKRAVPEFAQVLEKVSKLDRYTEASVGKAEQAAKILFAIEHEQFSTGENPMDAIVKKKMRVVQDDSNLDGYVLSDGLANRIVETTSNQTFNLPPGASLKNFGTNIESDYEQFHDANFNTIAASCDTPPEIAKQMYNSNYSASRAAINGWGYIVDIDRQDFVNQFYRPFYRLWLEFEVLTNKIDAPGLVKAIIDDNIMVIEAYTACRFTGKNMPHIDPLKEVKAIREALGNPREGITPLISHEQASEMGGYGDFEENYLEYLEETEKLIKNEIPDVSTSQVTE